MNKKCLHIKVEGKIQKYISVVCVCIFEDYKYNGEYIEEPVLYFQQRRKTKNGVSVKERAIPLSKITYMSY